MTRPVKIAAPVAADSSRFEKGTHVSLALLNEIHGNANYPIPAGATLTGLISVVIWCDRFNAAFGSAPLAFGA